MNRKYGKRKDPDAEEKFICNITDLLAYFSCNQEPDYDSAVNQLNELEFELKEWGFDGEVMNKFKDTKIAMGKLKGYNNRYNGFPQYLRNLEHSLSDLQTVFLKEYRKSA